MATLPTPGFLKINVGVHVSGGVTRGCARVFIDYDAVAYPGVQFTYAHSPDGTTYTTDASGVSALDQFIGNLGLSASWFARVAASGTGYVGSGAAQQAFMTPFSPSIAPANPTAVSAVNASTPGTVLVKWTPGGNTYTYHTVTFTAAGETALSVNSATLVNELTVSGLATGKTWTITVVPKAEIASGTLVNTGTSITLGVLTGGATWEGPEELHLEQGVETAALWRLLAPGTLIRAAIGPLPAGLERDEGTFFDSPRDLLMKGAPTQEGIYAAKASASRITPEGGVDSVLKEVLVTVTGENCVGWLNALGWRVDLQFDVKARQVRSYAMGMGITTGEEGQGAGALRLVKGETRRLYLVLRDGLKVTVPTLTAAQLTVRLAGRLDSFTLLDVGGAPATETIAGRVVPYLEVLAAGDLLDRIFAQRNANTAVETAAGMVEGEADLRLALASGGMLVSRRFAVQILQDEGN